MSGGLSGVSDADLMRMIGQARASGGGGGGAPAAAPAAPAPVSGGDPGALTIRVRPNNVGAPASPAGPQMLDLASMSDADLMRQITEARHGGEAGAPPASAQAPQAPAGITAQDFGERFKGDLSAPTVMSDEGAASRAYGSLGTGMQANADERLVGPPSAGNAIAAAVLRGSNAVGLNIPRNAGAAIASLPILGNGQSFSENYRLAQDQEEALARQNPKSALAGTVGGIMAGGIALPGLAGARAASMSGRALQAAATGGLYGGASEGLDSHEIGRAGLAGAGGFVGGALLSPSVEKAAPIVMGWISKGVPFKTLQGGFTPEAEAALRQAGIDPANLPAEVVTKLEQAFAAKGVSPAIAREGAAAEFSIPLSRGQATQDPRALSMEQGAIAGTRGNKAQDLGQGFASQQAASINTARSGLQGMAARGAPVLENPAAASEMVADRARAAATQNASEIAATQRAQEAALQSVRPSDAGDALDAAGEAARGIRGAAASRRAAYGNAYDEVGKIEGQFAPGAFTGAGDRVRRLIGADTPISPRVTPAASEAMAMIEDMPRALGLRTGEEPTMQQVMLLRKGMSNLYGSTSQNGTDRHALGEVVKAFDQHVEDLLGIGKFQRPASAPGGAAARAADDATGAAARTASEPVPAGAVTLPPAKEGEPESLVRYLSRSGIPLDAEARAADLNRTYVPGRGTLARNNAPSWDELRVRLTEEGFFPYGELGGASEKDVADKVHRLIQDELVNGRKTYRMGDEASAGGQRAVDRVASENADHAGLVEREARKLAIDLEGYGLRPHEIDRAALNDAAEMVMRREVTDSAEAYDRAIARRGEASGAPSARAADEAPFPAIGEGASPATGDFPLGDTAPSQAMRTARGLFREYQQAFRPRGAGDDAGRLMRKIIEQDATPTEVANALFGSMTRPGETGLSVRFAGRLREALGEDSPVLGAVQQGLISRVLDGNGAGNVGQRLDNLLRGNGREAASAILTDEQRRGLGAFRAALYQTERAHQALPSWICDLSKSGFDPNAVATGLFGSGVPGTRIGSANFARGLKGFLGEDSAEWSGLRQAAIQSLTKPSGSALTAEREAERIAEFTAGRGAGLAKELFTASERGQLDRYAAALRSTVLPSGIAAPSSGQGRAMAANLLNGLLGAIAFKVGAPTAAAAPFTAKAGQRLLIGAPGAFQASRSFGGGAPRARPEVPVLDLQKLGAGSGLAVEYGVPNGR